VYELARSVTGESGNEQVRAVGQLILPVSGEHGGRKVRVETASEMTSFRRVRLGTGTSTRTKGQMTDYVGRYMALCWREWAVGREGGILTQLHWILSDACVTSNLRSKLRLGDGQTRS
jgi:hypothetical protein